MQETKMQPEQSADALAENVVPAEGTPQTAAEIRDGVVEALKTIYDPEIPVDIFELGLIYDVDVNEASAVHIRMTLTSPMCPVAESLPPEVESRVSELPGVSSAHVEIVWDPPWEPSRMSEAARLELGML